MLYWLLAAAYGQLIDARGAALTYAYCSACHSEQLVAQQKLSREDWEEVLQLMHSEHGMAPLPAKARQQILDYLSEHYKIPKK